MTPSAEHPQQKPHPPSDCLFYRLSPRGGGGALPTWVSTVSAVPSIPRTFSRVETPATRSAAKVAKGTSSFPEEGNTSRITDNRADLPQLPFMPRQPGRDVPPTRVALSQPAPRSGMLLQTHWDRERTQLQPAIPQVVLHILILTFEINCD